MLAGLLDIEIEQGATFHLDLLYQDEDGVPIGMAGMSARMQLRRQFTSTDSILALTTTNGRITIDVAEGKITLGIAASDTESLTGSGVYDLELVNGPVVNRIIQGSYIICSEVTK